MSSSPEDRRERSRTGRKTLVLGLANYSLWATSDLTQVENRFRIFKWLKKEEFKFQCSQIVSLKHSHTHLLHVILWLLCTIMQCQEVTTETMCPTNPKICTLWLLGESSQMLG